MDTTKARLNAGKLGLGSTRGTVKPTVLVIYGTRPEAIKVAPVIRALEASHTLNVLIAVTGQHREMLEQVNRIFDIAPHHDLNVFEAGQSLNTLMSKVFQGLDPILARSAPHAVLVQGDTSTVAAAAIASFYRQIPVVHLEAGLRSGDLRSPFPEEANRRIVSQIAALHLAPTPTSRDNLIREGIESADIVVTGNTVIDSLRYTAGRTTGVSDPALSRLLASGRPILLVTTHRRENWGGAIESIAQAVRELVHTYPELSVVLPLHQNPIVRDSIEPILRDQPAVHITDPLTYGDFTQVMAAASIVLTDSGGVQEEAPSLGRPVLVTRDNTERPEAVAAGTVRLVGTNVRRIVAEVSRLHTSSAAREAMSQAVNPYGDGHAAPRALAAIEELLGVGSRLPDFRPDGNLGGRS